MFSTPTMTITIGKTQTGTDDGKLDQPHPFQPISARTLRLMMAEQHNWTIPVIARPNFEWTRVAKLTWEVRMTNMAMYRKMKYLAYLFSCLVSRSFAESCAVECEGLPVGPFGDPTWYCSGQSTGVSETRCVDLPRHATRQTMGR